ncbi:hypothetical protein [Lacipirellula sp.]|uniref:hypothetical protein n=1 Tax=Lacipirellula sp. TaxID=2691419 RepID=UPI003D0ED6CF
MHSSALGAILAVLLMFPFAGLTALLYRFPVPIVGMVDGWDGVGAAMFGLTIYAMLGWILAPIALGAIGGSIAQRLAPNRIVSFTVAFAALSAFTCTITLATIDKIIGPW